MKILSILGNLLGIGKDYLDNKAKTRLLKQEQDHAIIIAETNAQVNRINSNTISDNEIDLITARNKKYSSKDEIITYLFLIPVFVASVTPFIVAWETGDWIEMNKYVQESYESLGKLPSWYRYVLGAIIVDVLGFRSFARKVIEKWTSKSK